MIFRTEHPKPQFMRENWMNLNGEWEFEIDNANSGVAHGFYEKDKKFSMKINVPFCPESKLSGIGNVDFMNAVWYKRTIVLSAEQLEEQVILHFGAVDYETIVYVNGVECGTHVGGYSSFSFNITDYVQEGENVVTVYAQDDIRNNFIPSGKQSKRFESYGCFYTRTTGIWQTVWLEFVPKNHIVSAKYISNIDAATLQIQAKVQGKGLLKVEASYEGKPMGTKEVFITSGITSFELPLKELHLWEVGKGRLYDLLLSFQADGSKEDIVQSYFGMRSLELSGYRFLINGKSVFQRLILDQGFYPDGIYTAPSEEELIADIERGLAMGFNGARLHEKIFEERYLYHCDRLGYLAWGEYPNWGLGDAEADSIYKVLPEWLEEIERDFNHPAIVGWCPFNETGKWSKQKGQKVQYKDLLPNIYQVTKAVDPTRPCIDTSGWYHTITDIYDVHDYEQNPEEFAKSYDTLPIDGTIHDRIYFQDYPGKIPVFVSEYGGIRWTKNSDGWGYGEGPKTPKEFLERLKGLTDVLLDNPCMFGLCYTQLTDVEQEQNGLYTYDREPKFEPAIIHKIFSRKAAIEEEE